MTHTRSLFFSGISLTVAVGTIFVLQGQHRSVPAPTQKAPPQAITAPPSSAPKPAAALVSATLKSPANPLPELIADYDKGNYKAVEAKAKLVVTNAAKAKPTRTLVRAQHLLAFASARSRDLKKAREQFAQAHQSAVLLKEKRQAPKVGEQPSATLEEDSAYQHAACTMGLGEKAAAQTELIAFMKDYPTSPLVHAAMRRIARLNDGNIPPEAEVVWKKAKQTQLTQQRAEERLASLCGPECLAELLKRQGEKASLETLAQELHTSHEGTSLAALERVARKHGFPHAEGVQLTATGLQSQKLPLIALLTPGHFVLVEKLAQDGSVTFWDANATGIGKEGSRTVSAKEWTNLWMGGIALRLSETPAPTRTDDSQRVALR